MDNGDNQPTDITEIEKKEVSPAVIKTRVWKKTHWILHNQEIRRGHIDRQRRKWIENWVFYSYSTTPEVSNKFRSRTPSSIAGQMARAFSPDGAYLDFQRIPRTITEEDLRRLVILDPEKIPNICRQLWIEIVNNDTERAEEDIRSFFQNTTPFVTGRIFFTPNGKIGKFQQNIQWKVGRWGKRVWIENSSFTLHDDIYDCLGSQVHASKKLINDIDDLGTLNPEIASLVHQKMLKITDEDNDFLTWIKDIVTKIKKKTKKQTQFFYIQKMIIDYLLKLNGGQYDEVRINQSITTLRKGMNDRIGRKSSIQSQSAFLNQETYIEWARWKSSLNNTPGNSKLDPNSILTSIQDNYDTFMSRMSFYSPGREGIVPPFEPFTGFQLAWQLLYKEAKNQDSVARAQRLFLQQYFLLFFQEMKLRYGYWSPKLKNHNASLQERIKNINTLSQKYSLGLENIVIDFTDEPGKLRESLKTIISSVKNLKP